MKPDYRGVNVSLNVCKKGLTRTEPPDSAPAGSAVARRKVKSSPLAGGEL